MKDESLVSVIILNYNAGKLLLDCVESIKKSKYNNLEIIVVDNISSDNSQTECKEKFPDIKLIQNDENFGYCEGNNIGIRNAKGEYIIVLNPDTIVEENSINELVSAYKEMGDGLFQPKILSLHEEDVLQSTGNMIQIFGFGFARDKGERNAEKEEKIEKIGYASGTCLFTSKRIFEKIGYFDKFLFLYHDALDLGWRASQMGINSYYVPKSKIFHVESYSLKWSSKKFYWLERNRKYCLQTHYSKETYSKIKFSLFVVDILVWLFYLSKGFLVAKIKAELDIKKNKEHIIKKYNELEKRKLIPDKELIKYFPDEIFVPKDVSKQSNNKNFNSVLTRLSKKVKKEIL